MKARIFVLNSSSLGKDEAKFGDAEVVSLKTVL
jgi:hypothetical protein